MVDEIRTAGRAWMRDYVTDGVPASGANPPSKAQGRALFDIINDLVTNLTGPFDIKGVIDCSANPNYPAATEGDLYFVSVAGKIGGASGADVGVKDMLVCKTTSASGTHAAVGANWLIVPAVNDGAVIGPASATDGHFAQFDGTTGEIIKGGLALTINTSLTGNSDTNIPSEKAVKAYTDAEIAARQAADDVLFADYNTKFAAKVTGPASVTANHFAQFDGTTGKLVKGGLALTTSTSLAGNSDTNVPSEAAVKAYVDTTADISTTAILARQLRIERQGRPLCVFFGDSQMHRQLVDYQTNGGAFATTTHRSRTSNVATLTTAAPHALSIGRDLSIAGLPAAYNGEAIEVLSVPTTTTFTYASVGSNEGTTADTAGQIWNIIGYPITMAVGFLAWAQALINGAFRFECWYSLGATNQATNGGAYYTNMRGSNGAANGAFVADILAQCQRAEYIGYRPDVVCINGGTNDINYNPTSAWMTAEQANMRAACRIWTQRGIPVLLFNVAGIPESEENIYPGPTGPGTNRDNYIVTWNALLQDIADEESLVTLVDVWTVFDDASDPGWADTSLLFDGLHYNQKGAQKLAYEAVAPAIKSVSRRTNVMHMAPQAVNLIPNGNFVTLTGGTPANDVTGVVPAGFTMGMLQAGACEVIIGGVNNGPTGHEIHLAVTPAGTDLEAVYARAGVSLAGYEGEYMQFSGRCRWTGAGFRSVYFEGSHFAGFLSPQISNFLYQDVSTNPFLESVYSNMPGSILRPDGPIFRVPSDGTAASFYVQIVGAIDPTLGGTPTLRLDFFELLHLGNPAVILGAANTSE